MFTRCAVAQSYTERCQVGVAQNWPKHQNSEVTIVSKEFTPRDHLPPEQKVAGSSPAGRVKQMRRDDLTY
jgi:hypothetical protein